MQSIKKYPNIEAERARKGMTVNDLTAYLKVSRKTYYNWCNRGSIPLKKITLMADLFGTTVEYLLGRSSKRTDTEKLQIHDERS